MGIQTKSNRVLAARVFPCLAPDACICFEFWLARWAGNICCDWPELSLWFWFYDTQLKTSLKTQLGCFHSGFQRVTKCKNKERIHCRCNPMVAILFKQRNSSGLRSLVLVHDQRNVIYALITPLHRTFYKNYFYRISRGDFMPSATQQIIKVIHSIAKPKRAF